MLGQIKFKNIKHQKHLEKNILIQILGNFCEITPNFWSIKPPKLKDKSRDEPMEIQTPRQVRVPPILWLYQQIKICTVHSRTFQHQDTTKYLKNRLVLGDMIWLLLHNLITYSISESPQEYYFNNNVGSNLKIPIGFDLMLLKNSPTAQIKNVYLFLSPLSYILFHDTTKLLVAHIVMCQSLSE